MSPTGPYSMFQDLISTLTQNSNLLKHETSAWDDTYMTRINLSQATLKICAYAVSCLPFKDKTHIYSLGHPWKKVCFLSSGWPKLWPVWRLQNPFFPLFSFGGKKIVKMTIKEKKKKKKSFQSALTYLPGWYTGNLPGRYTGNFFLRLALG